MSRSLRSRPMTLYQVREGEQSIIPPVPEASSAFTAAQASTISGQGNEKRRSRLAATGGKNKRGPLSKASEVGSNLKKRLSMRYAEPTELGPGGFSAIPDVPAMPSDIPGAPDLPPGSMPYGTQMGYHSAGGLPIMGQGFNDIDEHGGMMGILEDGIGESNQVHSQARGESVLRGRSSLEEKGSSVGALHLEGYINDPAIDLDMLSQENFDPQIYLKMKLSTSSEDFLRQFQDSLLAAKEAASSDLKRQVFRSYQDFITISKEIATLENDMLELKELLGEWKTLPQALELEEGGASLGTLTDSALRGRSNRNNRNSMIDLQQIYRAQIMSLWEGIEGSQKFLPYIPGRHLIAEASSFTELNAATYKPKQSVALFLLDDLLLVAVRKKRQMSARVRLVAERCFSLSEIVVVDLKDGGDLTNAIKIKRAKESFVYRTERSEDKRALLNAFRRVAEELANKRRKESMVEAETRKRESNFTAARGNMQGNPFSALTGEQFLADDANREGEGNDPNDVADNEKKDASRWLSDFSDQVSVAIALREWGEAATLIEKGQAMLAGYSASDFAYQNLSIKLQGLTSQLVDSITHNLSSPTLKKSAVVRNVGFLLRLDRGERAREVFLQSRSELLKKRSRQIKFEGDVSLYISELALVHFTLIKNTSEWYMSAFKDNRMASGFVKWAMVQVESYAEIFRRQVYGIVDQDPKVVLEAVEITMNSASQLGEVGLDLTFFLRNLLTPEESGNRGLVVPSLTVTLADDPDALAKRLSSISIKRHSSSSGSSSSKVP
ncbi:hypothetical protein CBS101457_002170 [Exobasidium rhododendri]|nr:hypothetical protein CBS101457_002170 [Exobasidium rhododendri]